MGRVAISCNLVEETLNKYTKDQKFVIGLLIGQPNADGKDYIVYAAKTSDHESENEENPAGSHSTPIDSMDAVDPQVLVNHAVAVTRMIPGSFFVQGIFVVSEKNVFQDDTAAKKVRLCVQEINKILSDTNIFRSDTESYDMGEKLILYCSPHGERTCKSMNVAEPLGSVKPAEWKALDKQVSWHIFETNYEIDEVFPLFINEKVVNLEDNFFLTLKSINTYLEQSAIFIHQDNFEDDIRLETLVKMRRDRKEKTDTFKASIFFPATVPETDQSQVVQVHGTVRYNGIVYSRVWAHPQTLLSDIKHYIRNDILRSLAARVQIYCDSLSDPIVHEGAFIISEPPRRVFIKMSGSNGIQFCEYLFRGEGADVVLEQAKGMLDVKITAEDVETELESLPVYEDEVSTLSDFSVSSNCTQVSRQDVRRHMYLLGILGAVTILILSLVLQFMVR